MNATIFNGSAMFRVVALMLGFLVVQPDAAMAGGAGRGNTGGAGLCSSAAKLTKIDRARMEAEIAKLAEVSASMELRDAELRALEIATRVTVFTLLASLGPVGAATGATAAQLTAADIVLNVKDVVSAAEIAADVAEIGVELWKN